MTSSRETLRFSGNKIDCSPRDKSLSGNCFEFLDFVPYFSTTSHSRIISREKRTISFPYCGKNLKKNHRRKVKILRSLRQTEENMCLSLDDMLPW